MITLKVESEVMGYFELETAVVRLNETTWEANLVPGWRIGEMMNGGYLLAIAGRVLGEALPNLILCRSMHFTLLPPLSGPSAVKLKSCAWGKIPAKPL